MKTKHLFIAATAILAFASCSSNDFVGEEIPQNSSETNGAISFTSATPAITRATGSGAATLLNNNFVVFGYKTVSAATQTVFDNYQVNWVTNTANTTESNSADWEYVGYKNLPYGTGTKPENDIVLNNDGVATNATATGIEQSIKYWDFSASQYDFFAYSLGTGNATTWAQASALSNSTYTLEGTKDQLATCYISNKEKVVPSSVSPTQVNLNFRSFLSQIELKFYETIPGYSVKDVTFYPSADGVSSAIPYLYTSSAALPIGGRYTVTFDDDGKAILSFDASAGSKDYVSKLAFGTALSSYVTKEYKEAAEVVYLGRTSTAATSSDPITVLPNPDNDQALHLKMDFTLLSRDGTGETIEMKGATAVVPAAYAMWQPNYKYTYIFKISDNTNAKTSTITGLYPITLDAVVTDAVDGTQETITTVDDPSITTYANASMVTANNEYLTGSNIYIVVNDGTDITANTDAKLYTAAITLEDVVNPRPAAQGITEETVANALAQGGSVVDANGATLAVTDVTASLLTDITEIAAADAPNGQAITIDGVKFTPASRGDYVFEYSIAAVNYNATEVATINAALTGAIAKDAALTAEQATAYNAKLDGALPSDPTTLTTDQATAYNAKFVALTTESALTAEQAAIYNAATGGTKTEGNTLTTEEVASYNTAVGGTKAEGGTLTAAQAAAYNSLLTGAKATGNTLSESEANTYNAKLPGAISESDVKTPGSKHYKVIKVVAAP